MCQKVLVPIIKSYAYCLVSRGAVVLKNTPQVTEVYYIVVVFMKVPHVPGENSWSRCCTKIRMTVGFNRLRYAVVHKNWDAIVFSVTSP